MLEKNCKPRFFCFGDKCFGNSTYNIYTVNYKTATSGLETASSFSVKKSPALGFLILVVYIIYIILGPATVLAATTIDITQGQILELSRNINAQLEPLDVDLINQVGGSLNVDLYFNDNEGQKVDIGDININVLPGSIQSGSREIDLQIIPEKIKANNDAGLADNLDFVNNLLFDFKIASVGGGTDAKLIKDANVILSLSQEVTEEVKKFDLSSINAYLFDNDKKEWVKLLRMGDVSLVDNDILVRVETQKLGKIALVGRVKVDPLSPIESFPLPPPPNTGTSIERDSGIVVSPEPTKTQNQENVVVGGIQQEEISAKDNILDSIPSSFEPPGVQDIVVGAEALIPQIVIDTSKVVADKVAEVYEIIADKTTETAEIVMEKTEEFVKSPGGQITVAVTRPVGVISGGVLVSSQVILSSVTVTSFSDVYLLIIKALGFVSGLFKRKKRYWGTAFDSVTKRPLDPAYVVVKSGTQEMADAITDLDGRFGFLLPPGVYKLEAQKTNYQFPSKILQNQQNDILYDNLYHGENIETKEGEVIIRNIPLDPITFDWNEFQKDKQQLFRLYSRREKFLSSVFNFVYLLGLLAVIAGVVFDPKISNYIFLAIYLVFIAYQLFWLPKKRAVSLKFKNGEPIPFAIIKIFSPETDEQIKSVVTDKMGRFYFLVGLGKYYLTIDEKQADGSYKTIHKSGILDLKKGIIGKDIVI